MASQISFTRFHCTYTKSSLSQRQRRNLSGSFVLISPSSRRAHTFSKFSSVFITVTNPRQDAKYLWPFLSFHAHAALDRPHLLGHGIHFRPKSFAQDPSVIEKARLIVELSSIYGWTCSSGFAMLVTNLVSSSVASLPGFASRRPLVTSDIGNR